MLIEKHSLRELFPQLPDVGFDAKITLYIPMNPRSPVKLTQKRPCLVLCPGGGYHTTVPREGEPVALHFCAEEIPVCVVDYSCVVQPDTGRVRYPIQLQELSCAVAYMKRRAEEFEIDPEKIFIGGFSAGGHAAGSLGCLWHRECAWKEIGLSFGENKPRGMLLFYPVISSGEYAHRGSFNNLCGPDADQKMLDSVSLEKCVDENTVPAYLWQTFEDELVPVQNSMLMGKALADAKIPFEMHIYPTGPHGMSSATKASFPPYHDKEVDKADIAHIHNWLPNAIHWMKQF